MLTWIWITVASGAVASSLVGGVIYVFRSYIVALLVKRVEADQLIRVEEVKASLAAIADEQKRLDQEQKNNKAFVLRSLENFRSKRSDLISELQVKAIQAIWNDVVNSYKVRLHTTMLQSLRIEEILKMSKDQKIKQFASVIAPKSTIEEYMKSALGDNALIYRPYVPQKLWEYFTAYKLVISMSITIFKTIELGLGEENFLNFEAASKKLMEVVPSSKPGFEKYGWTYMFHQDTILENLIIGEIRKFLEGEEADAQQIELATSLMQMANAQVSET